MFKKILVIAVLGIGLLCGVAHAGRVGAYYTIIDNETPMNNTAAITSDAVDIRKGVNYGIMYQCTSTVGTPSIKIEYELSADNSTFVSPVGVQIIDANCVTENVVIRTVTGTLVDFAPYIRFKATGSETNATDTYVTLKFYMQEED